MIDNLDFATKARKADLAYKNKLRLITFGMLVTFAAVLCVLWFLAPEGTGKKLTGGVTALVILEAARRFGYREGYFAGYDDAQDDKFHLD